MRLCVALGLGFEVCMGFVLIDALVWELVCVVS